MEKETNFVDCSRCTNWDDKERYFKACPHCHNTKRVPDPKDIACNMCGGPQRPLGTHNEQYPHGLENAFVEGGYDSYHLFDMTEYKFSFCEKCLRELFNRCKIPPTVTNKLGDYEEETYVDDLRAYEYRVWKDNGGHHQAYLDRKCNAIKDCPNRAEYTIRVSGEFTEDCCCEEHKHTRNNCMNCTKVKFIQNFLKPFL